MKYLAILKDSLREAIDTKVFYVMLGASGLLVLLVACLSFKPRPVADLPVGFTTMPLNVEHSELSKLARNLGLPFVGASETWTQAKVEPEEGAADSPDSPLRFTIHASYSESAAANVRTSPAATMDYIKDRFATFGDWKTFEVSRVELLPNENKRQLSFLVHTLPTSATRRIWPCEPSFLFWTIPGFKEIPLGMQLNIIEDTLVNGAGAWVGILVSIVITAFFVPNMLRKGTVELLLVKPLHRATLLLYKYIGGLMFIFLNTAFVVSGIWLVLGLRSGIWATGFLLTIFIITFFFAILYSVSVFFSVLTGSPIVSILLTCLVWVVFISVGWLYIAPDLARQIEIAQERQEQRVHPRPKKDAAEEPEAPDRTSQGAWVSVVKAVHFVLPRYRDLTYLTSRLLTRDLLQTKQLNLDPFETATFSWGESLSVDVVFIALMLGLSCLRFALKDY